MGPRSRCCQPQGGWRRSESLPQSRQTAGVRQGVLNRSSMTRAPYYSKGNVAKSRFDETPYRYTRTQHFNTHARTHITSRHITDVLAHKKHPHLDKVFHVLPLSSLSQHANATLPALLTLFHESALGPLPSGRHRHSEGAVSKVVCDKAESQNRIPRHSYTFPCTCTHAQRSTNLRGLVALLGGEDRPRTRHIIRQRGIARRLHRTGLWAKPRRRGSRLNRKRRLEG